MRTIWAEKNKNMPLLSEAALQLHEELYADMSRISRRMRQTSQLASRNTLDGFSAGEGRLKESDPKIRRTLEMRPWQQSQSNHPPSVEASRAISPATSRLRGHQSVLSWQGGATESLKALLAWCNH
jgi:hypothetical protein